MLTMMGEVIVVYGVWCSRVQGCCWSAWSSGNLQKICGGVAEVDVGRVAFLYLLESKRDHRDGESKIWLS